MLYKIKQELLFLKQVKQEIIRKTTNVSGGKLTCRICRGNFQYYDGKRYLKSNERKFATQLAEKEYCEKLYKVVSRYAKALEVIEDIVENERLQNVFRGLHPARQVLVEPIYRPIEQVISEFEQIPCEGKGFEEENTTTYYTIKGERVRSKSEKIIADELYRHGIPYKYELPIELDGWNRKITVYPDFTVLNKRTGKRWIIEHLGMMDSMGYSLSTMQKLTTYENNDILVGRDLILLHETSTGPLNTRTLEKYINEFLC